MDTPDPAVDKIVEGSSDSSNKNHFLGKRPHVKEPPWDSQRDHSQKKKMKKKKKVVKEQEQIQARLDKQNIAQTGTVVQSQPTQSYPVILDRPQILQHQPLVMQAPQNLMAARSAPLQYQQIPWVMVNANQHQQLQQGIMHKAVTQQSYMNFR